MKTSERSVALTLDRILLGWISGSLMGGALIAVASLIILIVGDMETQGAGLREIIAAIPFGIASALVAALIFAAGIAFVGGPFWALLHALELRNWPHAVALGAILCGGVVAISTAAAAGGDWTQGATAGAVFAVIGAIAGFVVWRVAYRPVKPTWVAVF